MNVTAFKNDHNFWDEFAPWYNKWGVRGNYYSLILREINSMIEPGWNVIDIGSGTGALAIPMANAGCNVLAIEPSEGMAQILKDKLCSLKISNVEILREQNWKSIIALIQIKQILWLREWLC